MITALAIAQAAHGDYEAAIKSLDKAIDLQPGDVTNQYRIALIRLRGGDLAGYRAGL